MSVFNPWFILGALLALFLAFGSGHHIGYKSGVEHQAIEDQKQFDKINADLATQKAEANEKYRKAQQVNIALMDERDQLKTRLGVENVKNQDVTNRLRDAYAAYGLRFQAAEGSGGGDRAGCSESPGSNPAGHAVASFVQLPETIARNLRQLVFDADQLNDDYKLCYGYAYPMSSPP